ncbi:phosphatidylinositide phosphatase SAC2-like isoform X2 [Convolutriloba macropyga]|uniref:phosphatidylinositide phosphatase SAC2-like isoform X2 n=1 Tax=Convolutriloba macropyga TaxID=536237 RepID=UPI003F5212C4
MAVLSDKSSQLPAMEVFVTNDGNLEILRSYGTKVHKLSIDMAGGEMRYDAESVTEDLETTVLQHDDGIRRCYGCIFGIIGVLKVPPSDWLYLIVITEAKELFTLPAPINKTVYAVSNIGIIRINRGQVGLQDLQLARSEFHSETPLFGNFPGVPVGSRFLPPYGLNQQFEGNEAKMVREVRKLFCDEGSSRERRDFYFVADGNLCSTYQRHCSEDQQEADETNDTFFWNKVMLQRLPPQSTQVEGGFGVRLVHGFATHFTMTMEEEDVSQDVPMYMQESFKFSQAKTVTIFLVSRRSRHRAGRRYKRRGVDPDGNVANFVETETIIYGENTKFFSSFVQIRGSIPLYWTHELAGVKYQAQMKKCRSVQDNNSAFKKHFETLKRMYGSRVAVVNLVAEEKEKLLWTIFAEAIADLNSPDLYFFSFDYHAHTKRAPADELEKFFLDNFRGVQNHIGFSYGDHQGLVKFQKGVYRINCVDCLDRTNVVQRWLAESVVKDEMVRIGCLLPEDNVPMRLRAALKNMWHENGNAISRQYTGTDALKGDVTRTGKREMTGFLRDGVNSLERRYVMAQFRDTILQCVIDLLTLGYSDEPGFNMEAQIIEIAKKRIEQSDEFWSAWLVDHLESHVDVSPQNTRNRLFPVNWTLSKDSETAATFQVLIISSNNFYLVYVLSRPDKLKVVKVFKIPVVDLDSLAFGTVLNSGSDACCLQIFHPIPTTASGITTVNQITLKPVDLDEASPNGQAAKNAANGVKFSENGGSNENLNQHSNHPGSEEEQLCYPERGSEEYSKSRAIVDKIVEDFAKARSRLSLSIKVKSGHLEVASSDQISMLTAGRKLSAQAAADKLRGFLSVGGNKSDNGGMERTRSSEDVLNSSSKSFTSPTNSVFVKSSQFLNRIKPKEFLGRLNSSNNNSNIAGDNDQDVFDGGRYGSINTETHLGLRRQSNSESNLSSTDSILNIELANSSSSAVADGHDDPNSMRNSQEDIAA